MCTFYTTGKSRKALEWRYLSSVCSSAAPVWGCDAAGESVIIQNVSVWCLSNWTLVKMTFSVSSLWGDFEQSAWHWYISSGCSPLPWWMTHVNFGTPHIDDLIPQMLKKGGDLLFLGNLIRPKTFFSSECNLKNCKMHRDTTGLELAELLLF